MTESVDLGRRLAAGDIILIDGGTSTELEARDFQLHQSAWSGSLNLDHLDAVQAVHEDYIRAGAEVIISNTYATSRAAMEPAGLGDRVAEVNRRAVEAALRARDAAAGDRPVAVAGSMSSFTTLLAGPVLRANAASFSEQAAILAKAGVDLIVLEMIDALDYGPAAMEAAAATGLPVWLGMSPARTQAGALGVFEEPVGFEELVAGLVRPGLAAVNVMHAKPDVVAEALGIIRRYTDVPLGAYAETGEWISPKWHFTGLSPEEYCPVARSWLDSGAQLIGGCCGTRPAHIRALAASLPRSLPAVQPSAG